VSLIGESDRKILKMAVKNARASVRTRTVPANVVAQLKDKVLQLEKEVDSVLMEEKEEKMVRFLFF
jgi:ATP-dependent RNA helicase DDX27